MEFASSSSKLPGMYDVLINFSGEDIQRKFVSHLDSVLSAVGFTTFLHHENAVKSTDIQEPILNVCRVAIVVFTKSYSESAWCLNQLQQIIQCHQTYCRHVLPVYYEIQPSDVRLQKGDFGKALKATAKQTFSGEQLEDAMSRWSHALTKAANLFGWDESNHGSDAELVDTIVKTVLNLPVLSATKFPVGLQSQVEDLIRTIKSNSTGVFTVAITGEKGCGKTTLAKAIYNELSGTFNEKRFIEDIGQFIARRSDLPLAERVDSDVLETKTPSGQIRRRPSAKRMLIVLDDTADTDPHQIISLIRSYLGGGSVIIITETADFILRSYLVNFKFLMKVMNADESLELLSWHAFREAKPKEDYNELAKEVVAYCEGLPLALEVIGSSLFGRTKEEWNTVLLKLEKIPPGNIQRKLKVGFKGLRNQMEKDLFLDICRCFDGKDRAFVTKILNGCGVDADSGIRVLIERRLVQVNKNNKLVMHPLLREMGNEIIRKISKEEPSPGFDDEYARTDNSGNSWPVFVPLRSAGDFEYKKQRWVSLQRFYSKYQSKYFYPKDAIAVYLKHSLVPFVWKKPQVLTWLKVLNLSHSEYLIETPDFFELPCLEQLILKYCPRLRKVHQSIRCLYYLTLLNLKDCTSLSNLPTEIYELKFLKTLILSGCSKIDLLEKDIKQMESLRTLIAENTVVKQVPFSIVNSKSIGYISLCGFERLPRNLFPSIIRSWMSPTTNPISCNHLLCMDMEDNSWDDITPLLSSLANLRSVLVKCDTEFELLKQVKNILVDYFPTITESGISKQHFTSFMGVGAYHEFFHPVIDKISQVSKSIESCDVSLPDDNDPYWLAHKGEGHSVSFTVPPHRHMKGMALCVVYLSTPEIIEPEFTAVLIVNYTKCTLHIHNHGFNNEDWDGIMSNLGSGDQVEIFVSFGHGLVVKNTVVYPICSES